MTVDGVSPDYKAICICGSCGFPISATAARIIMVGKALQQSGIPLRVLHCGPSPIAINKKSSGSYDGIAFQYTTSVKWSRSKLVRILNYARSLVAVTRYLAEAWPHRRSTVVYLYVMDGLMNLCLGAICQLLGFTVIQELCEWPPISSNPSVVNRLLYKGRIFRCATGALVISKAIEHHVRRICAKKEIDIVVHRLPVLVDAQRFAAAPGNPKQSPDPTFVYCGTWLKDVLFVIRALAQVRRAGFDCKLMIIGEHGQKNETRGSSSEPAKSGV